MFVANGLVPHCVCPKGNSGVLPKAPGSVDPPCVAPHLELSLIHSSSRVVSWALKVVFPAADGGEAGLGEALAGLEEALSVLTEFCRIYCCDGCPDLEAGDCLCPLLADAH